MSKIKAFLIKILKLYKKVVPNGISDRCIYTPTCSEYAMEAIQKRNLFVAMFLIIRRLLRCNPLAKGGFDPVPDSQKIKKWLV